MSAPTSYIDFLERQARGECVDYVMAGGASGSITAGTVGSGTLTALMLFNGLGTTINTGPFVTYPTQPGLDTASLRLTSMQHESLRSAVTYINAIAYKLGIVDFTSTGNRFTHDAGWTGPLLAPRMGPTNLQPISGSLWMSMNTATATTAPVFTTNYTNQAGASITGAKTWTAPAAATLAGSTYLMRLEDGDTSVRDVSAVNVSVASASGTATLWMLKMLGFESQLNTSLPVIGEWLYNGCHPPAITPAVATSGTVPWMPVFLAVGSNATNTGMKVMRGVNTA